jgi:hypothetical protein
MTDFTETVKQNAVLTFSVVILSSIALTFLILLYTGLFGFGDKTNVKPVVVRDTIVEGVNRADRQVVTSAVTTASKFIRVKLPMLYGAANTAFVDGKKRGCDTVYMVDAWARSGGDPIAQHIQTLFDGITPVDFLPGNYVRMYQRDMRFDHVDVKDGVARVYLTGQLNEVQSSCEAPRLQIQIEEIVFQYAGITRAEVFVNDLKL